MKAVQFHAYGPAGNLIYEDVPDGRACQGEVLIKVEAIGVNPADLKIRAGMFAAVMPPAFPKNPGYDVAGTIIEVGANILRFRVGDRVLAKVGPFAIRGAYAEMVTVPESHTGHMPEGLAFEIAAALPTPGLTGLQLIDDHLLPNAEDWIVVTGLTGAVGRAVLYAAKNRGARVIAAVRPIYAALAQALGADDLFCPDDLTRARPSRPVRAAIDTVGGLLAGLACSLLPGNGIALTVATDAFDAVHGIAIVPRFVAVYECGVQLERIASAASRGNLTIPPLQTMALEDAAWAHADLEFGRAKAKVILIP